MERLFSTLQGKRVVVGLEDRVVWKETKNEIFSVKSPYNTLEPSCVVPFPWSIIRCPCVPTKVGFCCLGSFMGEGPNLRSTQEEGVELS